MHERVCVGATHLGQKLLNRKMSSIPAGKLETSGKLGALGLRPACSPEPHQPGPRAQRPGQGLLPGQGEPPSPPGRQGQREGGRAERRHRGLLDDAVPGLDHFAGGRGRQGVQVGGCRENPDGRSAEAVGAFQPDPRGHARPHQPSSLGSRRAGHRPKPDQPPGCECGRWGGGLCLSSTTHVPKPGAALWQREVPQAGPGGWGCRCTWPHLCSRVTTPGFLPAERSRNCRTCWARVPSTWC